MQNIYKSLWRGKSLLRTLMNEQVKKFQVSGIVVDVGGGKRPEYWDLLKKNPGTTICTLDLKESKTSTGQIDLEKDVFPCNDNSSDTVLCFNLLEHIYHHTHVVREMFRITKLDGKLVGFVPFLIQYHPDPHDYFRYTKEALTLLFTEAGYKKILITEIGGGPFFVSYNLMVQSMPRFLRVLVFPFCHLSDTVFLFFRPNARTRFPLGYFFECYK